MALVSVVLPTFNRAELLPRALESVLTQSYENWQLWIVDDGSTDQTQEVIKPYLKDSRIQVVTTVNHGVSQARNLAIRKSQSAFVAFLDSDDEWLPHKLEKQTQYLKSHDVPLVHGEEVWVRNGVRVNPMSKHKKSGGDNFEKSLKLCCISPSTVLLKRELLDEVGLFREDFPVCEDYDLWLRITHKYQVGFIEDFLITKYGGHEDQLSRKFKAMDYWRIQSMDSLLTNETLDLEKKSMLIHELGLKCQILLKGYRRHQNLLQYDEVFKVLQKLEND